MFGERLRHLRKKSGMSQTQLANQLGVRKQTISHWENGDVMPSVEMIKKICIYFSCSADYLLELETDLHVKTNTINLNLVQATHLRALSKELKKADIEYKEYKELCDRADKNRAKKLDELTDYIEFLFPKKENALMDEKLL